MGEGDPFSFRKKSPSFISRWIHLRRRADAEKRDFLKVWFTAERAYLVVSAVIVGGSIVLFPISTAVVAAEVLGAVYIGGKFIATVVRKDQRSSYRKSLRRALRESRD